MPNDNHRPQEDAIASLMDEMRQQQGYKEPTSTSTSSSKRNSNSSKKEQGQQRSPSLLLLLPELADYPDNTRCAGSHSIWNPHVQPTTTTTRTTSIITSLVSTSPQVEVIRRRAFEKFKQECIEVIQRTSQPWGIQKLPIPSMLEKWHMDSKVQDPRGPPKQKKQQQKQQQQESSPSSNQPIIASTMDIHQQIRTFQKTVYYDPILSSKKASPLFLPIFEAEIEKAWAKKNLKNKQITHSLPPKYGKKSQQIQKALHRCICEALENFEQQLNKTCNQIAVQGGVGGMNTNKNKNKNLPKLQHLPQFDQMQVTHSGISLRLHSAYFEKLQRLYDRARKSNNTMNGDGNSSGGGATFEEALFCMLCRYDMLQGAGLQAGVPGSVMDVLLEYLQCKMECFASPLNCRYESFGSAFDLDRSFGSVGSFFDMEFCNESNAVGGCYQANPPFCEGIIAKMHTKMIDALRETVNTDIPLMFVVFVPAWKESEAYQQLLSNNSNCSKGKGNSYTGKGKDKGEDYEDKEDEDHFNFLTKHLLLDAGKHWYAEGTQHRRKESFRVASFDTSILFYQNEAARTKWNVLNPDFVKALTDAFCQNPGTLEKTTKTPTTRIAPSANKPEKSHQQKIDLSSLAPSKNITNKRHTKEKPVEKKRSRGGKKQKFGNHEEESNAQLDLLKSLGLAGGNAEPEDQRAPKTVEYLKPKKKGSKKRKMK